jgi:hypothetical protein
VRLHEKYGNTSSKKPLVLFTYLDAQEHLPYADDSTAVTPKSELNGGIVVDTPTRWSHRYLYIFVVQWTGSGMKNAGSGRAQTLHCGLGLLQAWVLM